MRNEDYFDFILKFERKCKDLSEDIIKRLCKRAITKMNRHVPDRVDITYDYAPKYKFFDVLSIEIQSKYYDEINPYLRNYIEHILDIEYNNLPNLERFVLDYSECSKHLECDMQALDGRIFDTFHEMLNEHYMTQKIQDYTATHDC